MEYVLFVLALVVIGLAVSKSLHKTKKSSGIGASGGQSGNKIQPK